MSYRLETFGTLALLGPGGATVLGSHGHHRRRLALLAVVAAAGDRGRTRDQLLALFWPEASERRARHSLDQLLYALRSSIDESVFASRDPIRLDPAVITSDVGAFDAALAHGDLASAVALYRGPFLDGFHLGDAPEIERWLDGERSRLEHRYTGALTRLAERAAAAGDDTAAVAWRQRLVDVDPLSARHAEALIRALRAAGDNESALRYAERYEAIVTEELGTRVAPEVATLVAEIRAESMTAPRPTTIVGTDPTVERLELRREPSPIPMSAGTSDGPIVAGSRASPAARLLILTAATVATIVAAVLGLRAAFRQPSRIAAPSSAVAADPPALLTRDIAAYEALMRGRDPVNLRTRSDSGPRGALRELQQAVALDPGLAAAYANMPYLYADLAAGHAANVEEARAYAHMADSVARKALALDPTLPEAHAALGVASLIGLRDVRTAEAELRRSIALGGVPRVREYLGHLLSITHRPLDALAEAERSVQEDPLSASATAELGRMLCLNHRYDEGVATLARLANLRPPLKRVVGHLAFCYAMQGRWPEAAALLQQHPDARLSPFLGYALARSGDTAGARRIRDRLLTRWRDTHCGTMGIAIVNAGLGDTTRAFAWLDLAASDRSLDPVVLYPVYDELMNAPQWDQFLNRTASSAR